LLWVVGWYPSKLLIIFLLLWFLYGRQLPRPTREVAHVKIVRGFSASIWIWCRCLQWKPVSLDCTSPPQNRFLPFYISFIWASVYTKQENAVLKFGCAKKQLNRSDA
jgi:hypothetical protein